MFLANASDVLAMSVTVVVDDIDIAINNPRDDDIAINADIILEAFFAPCVRHCEGGARVSRRTRASVHLDAVERRCLLLELLPPSLPSPQYTFSPYASHAAPALGRTYRRKGKRKRKKKGEGGRFFACPEKGYGFWRR